MKINVELKTVLAGHNVEIINNISIEDLYHIIDSYENDFDNLDSIGSGSYGYVYGYNDYAIKRLHDKDNAKNRDIAVLKDLQNLDCIPTIYAVVNDELIIMERIKGVTVRDYCYNGQGRSKVVIDKDFIEKWENSLLDVIKAGYSPDDLHESNVMIEFETATPKFVDVGWFFKHNCEYNNFDIHTMKSDYGYSRAENWTGDALRSHVKRQEKKRQEEERERALEEAKAVWKEERERALEEAKAVWKKADLNFKYIV